MIDNLKLIVFDVNIIQRLLLNIDLDFEIGKPPNNQYYTKQHKKYGKKLRLHFRKEMKKGLIVGFRHLEIELNPHYHKNNYRHNGNTLTPLECIEKLQEIVYCLGISNDEFKVLKVVNLEFGVNLILDVPIQNIIDGLYFYKRSQFILTEGLTTSKRSDTNKYKRIKTYDKGFQFYGKENASEVHLNTFRYEISSKRSNKINKYGIENFEDLLNPQTYSILAQQLLNDWEHVLVVNANPINSAKPNLSISDKKYLKEVLNIKFWETMNSVAYSRNKKKYYSLLDHSDNLHTLLKVKMIDKLNAIFVNIE